MCLGSNNDYGPQEDPVCLEQIWCPNSEWNHRVHDSWRSSRKLKWCNSCFSASLGMCTDAPLNPSDLTSLHPLSPNSIDDLTSDLAARGLKRKKMSYDDLYNSFSPVSNSDTNASVHAASIGGNLSGYNMNGKGGVLHIAPRPFPEFTCNNSFCLNCNFCLTIPHHASRRLYPHRDLVVVVSK